MFNIIQEGYFFMNNGSRRRSRRRYKLRYDRIIVVALILIVLIFIITSCAKGCSDKKGKDSSSKTSVIDELTTQPPVTDINGQTVTDPAGNTVTQPPAPSSGEFTTQNVEYSAVSNGDLILVNSLYSYKFQEGDVSLATVYDSRNNYYGVSDMVLSLDSNVITQLNSMMEAFSTSNGNNTDLRVIGGFRDIDTQNDKYNNGRSKFQGGYSDYHTARTFDLGIFPAGQSSNYYKPEGIYSWINDNAANYGFIVRFPEGKDSFTGEEARYYTFRYVGVPHAVYMKQNGLCLEEYTEQIKSYTNSNPLLIVNGSSQYQVYYVAANLNNPTGVPVPSTLPYTISGNNVDGFIVTVTIAQ